jgi:hypothetical protein
MSPITRFRTFGIAGAACALAALVAACASEPPPAPVAVAPPVALPSKVLQAAAAYEAYVNRAAAITPDFTDGPSVGAKLRVGASYNAVQFQRGEVAYAAIVALQDPTFVAGVRAYTANPTTQSEVVNALAKDPAYVIGIAGSNSAAGLVIAALDAQGQKVRAAGDKVRLAAYEVQKQPWSKTTIVDRESRLAAVKMLSDSTATTTLEENARLRLAATGQQSLMLGGAATPPPYTPAVVRGLAVAALAVLGQGSEDRTDFMWAMLEESNQMLCLNLAKMNLNQCLAVAKPYYEDVFCLGVHAMMDTGACVVKGAGAPAAAPAVIAIAAPAPAPAMSPIPSAKPQ